MSFPAASPSSSDHYAWNATTASREAELKSLGVSISPRRIDTGGDGAGSAVAGVGAPFSSSSSCISPTASSWNAAGTWEERNVSVAAHATFKDRLISLVAIPQRGLRLHILSVEKVEGDVKLIHVRGKTRVGFELSVSASWELAAEGGARAAAGSLSFDAEDTEAGFFDGLRVVVTRADACASGEAVASVKASVGSFRAAILAWKEDLVGGGGAGSQ